MNKLMLLPGGIFAAALLAFLLLPRGLQEESAGDGIEALAARVAAQTGAELLSRELIPESDLPPEGTRSLFDHLIKEHGSLPFPFERMVEMLAAYDADGRTPNQLLIPDGRSLLKGHASFARPRMVVAADAQPPQGVALAPIFKGRLFLGFVDDAREIEVISYNEAAGRFEFQLVKNYCTGCVPQIVYAKRAICKTCHTNAAPIFPVRPWEETNAQPAISSRIAERVDGPDYFGAPLQRRLDNAEAFDNLTDVANVLPTTQSIWIDGCGAQGMACRRTLLKLALRAALNPTALDQPSEARSRLLELQAQNWPAAGIALPSGDLNNRNPLNQDLYDESFGAQFKRLLFPRKERVRSGDKLTDFDSLPSLPQEFDPLTPRAPKKIISAADMDGVYGVAQMFAPSDLARLEALADYRIDLLEVAVDALSDEYFAAAPLQRVVLFNALSEQLGAVPGDYCCLDVSALSAPIEDGEPPLELAEGSVLIPFERYCFACHRGNPAAHLDFMSGPDEATVLAKIKATEDIREVLDYARYLGSRKASKLMPPADSWQREELQRALERGEEPLQAMRDQVPSMFEF